MHDHRAFRVSLAEAVEVKAPLFRSFAAKSRVTGVVGGKMDSGEAFPSSIFRRLGDLRCFRLGPFFT